MLCCFKKRRNRRRNDDENRQTEVIERVSRIAAVTAASSQGDVLDTSEPPPPRQAPQAVEVPDSVIDVELKSNTSTKEHNKYKCFRRIQKWFGKSRKSKKHQKDVPQDEECPSVTDEHQQDVPQDKESPSVTDKVESNPTEKRKEHLQDLTCAICRDIAVGPHRCQPCHHFFCVWCVREMHRFGQITCALCRSDIQQEIFCRDLDSEARTSFPKEYFARYREVTQSTYCLGGGFRDNLHAHLAHRWYVLKRITTRQRQEK